MGQSTLSWVVWGVLLLVQNASFTLVSRARNSKSIGYHAVASVLSNGVYIIVLAFSMDKLMSAMRSGNFWGMCAVMVYYIIFTAIGSVSMHAFLMKHVEPRVEK